MGVGVTVGPTVATGVEVPVAVGVAVGALPLVVNTTGIWMLSAGEVPLDGEFNAITGVPRFEPDGALVEKIKFTENVFVLGTATVPAFTLMTLLGNETLAAFAGVVLTLDESVKVRATSLFVIVNVRWTVEPGAPVAVSGLGVTTTSGPCAFTIGNRIAHSKNIVTMAAIHRFRSGVERRITAS